MCVCVWGRGYRLGLGYRLKACAYRTGAGLAGQVLAAGLGSLRPGREEEILTRMQ